MSKTNLYAFYGSLRRGMRLYNQFSSTLHYRHSAWLKGYELFSLGNYPGAVESTRSGAKILVEIFEITDPQVEKELIEIERGAGYYLTQIPMGADTLNLFLYEHDAANNMRVESGDWVSFFRQ